MESGVTVHLFSIGPFLNNLWPCTPTSLLIANGLDLRLGYGHWIGNFVGPHEARIRCGGFQRSAVTRCWSCRCVCRKETVELPFTYLPFFKVLSFHVTE